MSGINAAPRHGLCTLAVGLPSPPASRLGATRKTHAAHPRRLFGGPDGVVVPIYHETSGSHGTYLIRLPMHCMILAIHDHPIFVRHTRDRC